LTLLFAERWVHLDDVQPEDLVYQIVRQLVSDLTGAGFSVAETKFRNALSGVRDFFKGRVALDKADVGMDPVKVSLRFEAFPTARKEFRTLLKGLLPTIYDLTNDEILALPAVPVSTRDGGEFPAGVAVLREIVRRRTDEAGVGLDEVFAEPDLLEEICTARGVTFGVCS